MSTNIITNQSLDAGVEFLKLSDPSVSTPLPIANPYVDVPDALKTQDNWVCFRHERALNGALSNVPYRADGESHAKSNDPSTWSTFDDALAASINPDRKFDGVSFMLLGTPYLGLDFDGVVKRGTLDRYVASILRVMGDPYAEISFSEEGLRVFVECPDLPRPAGKTRFDLKNGVKCGVEIYHGAWKGKALTVTGNRYSGQNIPTITPERFELVYLLCSQIHNEKFTKLWLGDTSEYGGNDSRADEALCCLLARLLEHNPEKIEAAFRWSGLARTKWTQRKDYRDITIAAAIRFEKARDTQPSKNQLVFHLPAVTTGTHRDYVIAPAAGEKDGWFPLGAVSLVGAPSGASKTTLMYQLMLAQACKGMFFGHETYGRSFAAMGIDRGREAHLRTMERMHIKEDAIPFEALSLAFDIEMVQQITNALEAREVMPELVFIEGVDMMVSQVNDIKSVATFMNMLNRVAAHCHIAIVGSLGSPKAKINQGYTAKRDNLLGSSGWGRECETVVSLQFPKSDDTSGRRMLTVQLRNAPAEKFILGFANGQLEVQPDTDSDANQEADQQAKEIEWYKEQAQKSPREQWWTILDLQRALGVSYSTARRHVEDAYAKRYLMRKPGKKTGRGEALQYGWNQSKRNPKWTEPESTESEQMF